MKEIVIRTTKPDAQAFAATARDVLPRRGYRKVSVRIVPRDVRVENERITVYAIVMKGER